MHRTILSGTKLGSGAVKSQDFHAEAQRTQRNKLPRRGFKNTSLNARPILFEALCAKS